VAYCKAAKDFIKGFLCPINFNQEEVHIKYCSRQQKYSNPYIY
jgi:hypothetical protein